MSRAIGVLSAALLAVGCWHDPTEIVVVVDSDLQPGTDFENISIQVGNCFEAVCVATSTTLPATLGIVPPAGAEPGFEPEFSVTASTMTMTMTMTMPSASAGPSVTRGAASLLFVSNEMRMLFLPLYRKCECQGTTCPNLTDPDCADINEPVLTEFDQDHLPRIAPAPAPAPASH